MPIPTVDDLIPTAASCLGEGPALDLSVGAIPGTGFLGGLPGGSLPIFTQQVTRLSEGPHVIQAVVLQTTNGAPQRVNIGNGRLTVITMPTEPL